jgi:hypothetical protein
MWPTNRTPSVRLPSKQEKGRITKANTTKKEKANTPKNNPNLTKGILLQGSHASNPESKRILS